MEVTTTTPKPVQIPRGASLSPNCDVWATSEVGIPLTELANSARGKKQSETFPLTIPAISDLTNDKLIDNDSKILELSPKFISGIDNITLKGKQDGEYDYPAGRNPSSSNSLESNSSPQSPKF